MMSSPNILIYRNHLLPPSETFIRAQAENLQAFTPYFAGSRRVAGLDLPDGRVFVTNRGGHLGSVREVFHRWRRTFPYTEAVRRINPALIHAHFGPDGVSAMPLASELGIPLVVTFHAYDVMVSDAYARRSFYSHRQYLRKRDALKRHGDLFIGCSRFIRDRMIQQGFPPEKTHVHYIGIDTDQFRFESGRHIEPVVLFVGRFVEKKGAAYLLQAMQKVQQVVPGAQLILLGDGPLKPDLHQMAQTLHLQHYVFLGMQPAEAVVQWMSRARVLAVPSVTAANGDSEGLPTVICEGLASGLPVVSTYHSGIPEVVVHEACGLLAAERDTEALAQHIIRLFTDDDLWQQFSHQGRQHVEKNFNIRVQTPILENLYREVVSASRKAGSY